MRSRRTLTVAGITFLAVASSAVAFATSFAVKSGDLGAKATSVSIPKRTPAASRPTLSPSTPVAPGTTVTVAATVTGGTSATTGSFGVMSFRVFDPVSAPALACSGSSTTVVASADSGGSFLAGGTYRGTFAKSVPGTYVVTAEYAGDARNSSFEQSCEQGATLTVAVTDAARWTGSCPSSATVVTYTRGGGSTWESLCSSKISGTASALAPSTSVTSVKISVLEIGAGYWSGGSSGNFNVAAEQQYDATLAAGTWSYGPIPDQKLAAGKTYTVKVYMTTNTGGTAVNQYDFKVS